jgi:hypothetical protein
MAPSNVMTEPPATLFITAKPTVAASGRRRARGLSEYEMPATVSMIDTLAIHRPILLRASSALTVSTRAPSCAG